VFSRWELKRWEFALIIFSLALAGGSVAAYVTDFPLRKYLFDIQDQQGKGKMGRVTTRKGTARRQLLGESDFRSLDTDATVYDLDTIVTGSDGQVTVTLDDGSSIDLGPDTMVRLAFESGFSLGGIARRAGSASVEVVTGNVKGQAKDNQLLVRTQDKTVSISKDTVQSVQAAVIKPEIPVKRALAQPLIPRAEIAKPVLVAEASPSPEPPPPPPPLPSPSPSPLPAPAEHVELVQLLNPPDGSTITLDPWSERAEKTVDLAWKITPDDARLLVTLYRITGTDREEVYHDVVAATGGKGTAGWAINKPGPYVWDVKQPDGSPLKLPGKTSATFTLDPRFRGIVALDPLVGGEKMTSNLLQGKQLKNFDITLKWNPYPDAGDYTIWFGSAPGSKKALLEKRVDKPEYSFNRDKVYTGSIYWRVSAALPSGFIAESEVKSFSFSFLAPLLVVPKDRATMTKAQLIAEDDSLLLTWQKTNFTEGYELEIGRDRNFGNLYVKQRTRENFYVFKSPPVGTYWWRVRAYSKNLWSPPSSANQILVTP
jgi:hypothetical protein